MENINSFNLSHPTDLFNSEEKARVEIFKRIAKGDNFVVTGGKIRKASGFLETLQFWLPSFSSKHKLSMATLLTDYLQNSATQREFRRDSETTCLHESYLQAIQTADKFIKKTSTTKKTKVVFQKLSEEVFRHKCHLQLPNLSFQKLEKHQELCRYIEKNRLHYVIPKAEEENRSTAILVDGTGTCYIRSEEGENFLNDPQKIDLIMQNLHQEHDDRTWLCELSDYLKRGEEAPIDISNTFKNRYCYEKIDFNELLSKSGKSYLAYGVTKHSPINPESIKPTFRESRAEPTYKIRIVTRIPSYALEKTYTGMLSNLLKNIFNFKSHGHSWVELVEKDGENHQVVYNVGYYFHPIKGRCHFKNADPIAYMPLPKEEIRIQAIEISKEKFEEAKLYVNHLQKMMKTKTSSLPSDLNLTPEQKSAIEKIYRSTISSTCLSFCTALTEAITQEKIDLRGSVRRFVFPKPLLNLSNYLEPFIGRLVVIRHFYEMTSFFIRMELPAWMQWTRTGQNPPVGSQPDPSVSIPDVSAPLG